MSSWGGQGKTLPSAYFSPLLLLSFWILFMLHNLNDAFVTSSCFDVFACRQTLNGLSWIFIIFIYALQPSRLIVRFGLDVPTFATRRLHACHHARAPSSWRWNCGREMPGTFCLNGDFHVIFRDLLHVVKLRHGTDGFTSPPKEGVLWIFFALKIRWLRPGANPRTWVPKASTLLLKALLITNVFRHSGTHGSQDTHTHTHTHTHTPAMSRHCHGSPLSPAYCFPSC